MRSRPHRCPRSRSNRSIWLSSAAAADVFIALSLIYVPFMQMIFQTEALERRDLGVLLLLAGTSMTLHEVRRRFERRLVASGAGAGDAGVGGFLGRLLGSAGGGPQYSRLDEMA